MELLLIVLVLALLLRFPQVALVMNKGWNYGRVEIGDLKGTLKQ